MPIHSGSWLGLPDLGITERIQSIIRPNAAYASSGGSNLIGSSQPQAASVLGTTSDQVYGPAYPGPQTTPTYRAPVSGTPTPTQQAPTDLIDQGLQSGNDSIERDYQDALMQADTAEQGLRAQAGQATSELNLQGTQTKNALEAQRQTAEAGVAGQEQTAQSQAKTATQQARDLFRQTQQQNIAQLSALGLSSSSVMEGLAEKLGVETARRIGAVSASVNDIMQNLSKERARVNDYAKAKTAEVEQQIGLQIQSIQSQLLQGIKQISDSRQLAATAKANARAELLSQAQNQIYQIQSNAQQFAQQMQQWAAQKNAAIAEANQRLQANTIDQTGLQNASSEISGIGNQLLGTPVQTSTVPAGYKYVNGKLVKDENAIINPFQ